METVGQRARRWRKAAGLTGEEAARALGTNPTVLYRYERREAPLPERWVRRMADLYGCRAGDIDPHLIDADELLLLEEYRQLTPHLRPQAHEALYRLRRGRPGGPGGDRTTPDDLLLEMARLLTRLRELMHTDSSTDP